MWSWIGLWLWVGGCVEPRTIGEDAPDFDFGGEDTPDDTDETDVSVDTDRSETDPPGPSIRVATWNVEGLGAVGSREHEAVRSILRRLDADVVALNEITPEFGDDLADLAEALGYEAVRYEADQPFGDLGNAILTRLRLVRAWLPDGADLAGESGARDVTRRPVVVTVEVPGTELQVAVVSQHWKSGFEPADAFRRAVDSARTLQAANLANGVVARVVFGDVNEQLADVPGDPAAFTSFPSGLENSYELGTDLLGRLRGDGIPNDPFRPFQDAGYTVIDAQQRDGNTATRPTSGRRIDWAMVNGRGVIVRSEVYDAQDDALPGLADGSPAPGYNDGNHASDHLPVLLELELP